MTNKRSWYVASQSWDKEDYATLCCHTLQFTFFSLWRSRYSIDFQWSCTDWIEISNKEKYHFFPFLIAVVLVTSNSIAWFLGEQNVWGWSSVNGRLLTALMALLLVTCGGYYLCYLALNGWSGWSSLLFEKEACTV
jgi:hypothetical protein